MHPHAELITRFYEAFSRRDHATMGACYHDDVVFNDEAFHDLHGDRARGMWRMLCERGTDLKLTYSGIDADDTSGKAHWEARYTFTRTGRQVLNIIDATFRFKDGLIVEHRDRFDFWKWSRQAFGPMGLVLGWTPILPRIVRKTAAQQLDAFLAGR